MSISIEALISSPPSRALRLVVPEARNLALREAGPWRRDTAAALTGLAAFGPAPAAPVPGQGGQGVSHAVAPGTVYLAFMASMSSSMSWVRGWPGGRYSTSTSTAHCGQ